MSNTLGIPVYNALTLESFSEETSRSLTRRLRLERLLDFRPWAGRNIIVAGPAGTGKTTLALQWALSRGYRVQYVSARALPSDLLIHSTPAWQGGEIVAELMNALLRPGQDIASQSQHILDGLNSLDIKSETVVIVDDVDLLPPDVLHSILESTAETMLTTRDATIVLITRLIPKSAHDFLSARGSINIISPQQLAVTASDLEGLLTLSPAVRQVEPEVRAAFQRYGGWIRGMMWDLNAGGFDHESLEDYILHELILTQKSANQSVIFALTSFPPFTTGLVESLLHGAGMGIDNASTILRALPLVELPAKALSQASYHFSIGLRESTEKLVQTFGNRPMIREFHEAGICWFIANNQPEDARTLALDVGLTQVYVANIGPLCAVLAHNEKWIEVHDLLRDLPFSSLESDPRLAYWRLIGATELGNWEEAASLHLQMSEAWKHSNDPCHRSKLKQISASRAWLEAKPELAMEFAALSYDLLPADHHQDKLIAAIVGENAARNLGDAPRIELWTRLSNEHHMFTSSREEWWHINCGHHRLSNIALTGKLKEAYEFPIQFVNASTDQQSNARFWYALAFANIDVERNDLDAAQINLRRAELLTYSDVTKVYLEILRATVFLASEQLDDARAILRHNASMGQSRIDQYYHRILLLASIEIKANNLSAAREILFNWFQADHRWPRYFGEPHHDMLFAQLFALEGDIDKAIEKAKQVTQEAEKRGHLAIAINGYALLAACYQKQDIIEEADRALSRAMTIGQGQGFSRAFSPLEVDVRSFFAHSHPSALNPRIFPARLTEREVELLRAVAEGYRNTEIANMLFISESTVKNHLASVYRKLGVKNRKCAIITANLQKLL